MKKYVFIIANALFVGVLLFIAVSCSSAKKITVHNTLDISREKEMVEVSPEQLGLEQNSIFIIFDDKGLEVPYQILQNGNIIFPVDEITASASRVYSIKKGKPTPPTAKTFARFIPERKDDFAWESDRIAFRMYGPALKPEYPSNGVDLWLKCTENLIIDKFYYDDLNNRKSYHVDHGEGLDCYKVGHTLGAGGVTPYKDGTLWTGNNFDHHKLIENGPLRSSFTLTYDSLKVNGASVKQTVTISIDAGSQLNKAVVKYETEEDIQIATGLFLHDVIGNIRSDAERGYIAYGEVATSDAGVPAGRNYVGVIAPPKSIVEITEQEQHLLIISSREKEEFTYYFGGGWSKWGFPTDEDWFNYMKKKAETAYNPLEVSF